MNYVTGNWSFDPFVIVVAGWYWCTNSVWPTSVTDRRPARPSSAGAVPPLLRRTGPPAHRRHVAHRLLGQDYFFVHMIEHILIAFFAPILIVGGAPWIPLLHGLPVGLRRRVGRACSSGRGRHRCAGRAGSSSTRGPPSSRSTSSWCSGTSRCSSTPPSEPAVHIWLMHASFFVTGILFWLPIIPSHPFRLGRHPSGRSGRSSPPTWSCSSWPCRCRCSRPPAGTRSTPTCPGSPFPRSPTSRSGPPSCGSAATSGPCRRWRVIIKRGIDSQGGFSAAFDRMLHRDAGPTLEQLRTHGGADARR